MENIEPAALLAEVLAQSTTYTIHPGVAESVRATADAGVLAAVDLELGNYHIARSQHGEKTEMEGGGSTVVEACRRGVPYLLRQDRWEQAVPLLEQMVYRDVTPATLAFAIPLLRQIVTAMPETEHAAYAAAVLARALRKAGRHAAQNLVLEARSKPQRSNR